MEYNSLIWSALVCLLSTISLSPLKYLANFLSIPGKSSQLAGSSYKYKSKIYSSIISLRVKQTYFLISFLGKMMDSRGYFMGTQLFRLLLSYFRNLFLFYRLYSFFMNLFSNKNSTLLVSSDTDENLWSSLRITSTMSHFKDRFKSISWHLDTLMILSPYVLSAQLNNPLQPSQQPNAIPTSLFSLAQLSCYQYLSLSSKLQSRVFCLIRGSSQVWMPFFFIQIEMKVQGMEYQRSARIWVLWVLFRLRFPLSDLYLLSNMIWYFSSSDISFKRDWIYYQLFWEVKLYSCQDYNKKQLYSYLCLSLFEENSVRKVAFSILQREGEEIKFGFELQSMNGLRLFLKTVRITRLYRNVFLVKDGFIKQLTCASGVNDYFGCDEKANAAIVFYTKTVFLTKTVLFKSYQIILPNRIPWKTPFFQIIQVTQQLLCN